MKHDLATAKLFYVSKPNAKEYSEGRKILDRRFDDWSEEEEEQGSGAITINSDGDTASDEQEQPLLKDFGEFLFNSSTSKISLKQKGHQ